MGMLVGWFWSLLLVAALGVCGAVAATPGWTPVEVNGNEGVALPPDDAPALMRGPGQDPDGYWMPQHVHLAAAEDALREQRPGYRQYAGFVENGERKIAVNAFCDPLGYDWTRQVVAVDDGGDCFWQAVYNVSTGEVERLTVNGNA